MKLSIFLGIFLLALSQARFLDSDPLHPRIINGRDAKPGEFPYQVSLQLIDDDYSLCGGSIINENYVITAAHCVKGLPATIVQVVAGTLKLSKPQSLHLIEKIIVHEMFKEETAKHDIALLKVKLPFVISDNIQAIPLPKKHLETESHKRVVISGWGKLHDGSAPDHLQQADLIIADQQFCKKAYSGLGSFTVDDSQICAYDPEVIRGSCFGDSGGPLAMDGVLVGIVSWALECGRTDYPTVFTRVSEFIDWIEEHAV